MATIKIGKIQLRRDVLANWQEVNPILDVGEPGFIIDTGELKIGDGSTRFNDLDPINSTITEVESLDPPTIQSLNETTDGAEIELNPVQLATGYQYRVNGGNPIDNGNNIFITVTGRTSGSSFDIEFRAYSGSTFSDWSPITTVQTLELPQGVPTNIEVYEGDDYAEVSFTGVSGATGYKYRLLSSPQLLYNIGNVTEFTINNLPVNTEQNLEILAYNDIGDGNWSATKTFSTTAEEPVISDGTITVTDITDEGATFGFTKATDPATVQANLVYKLYTGSEEDLSSKSAIEQLTPEMTATDVAEFVLTGRSQGENFYANVAVENEAGVISIYNPVDVWLDDPQILQFELTSAEKPTISTEQTHQIEWEITGQDGATETVSHASDNTDIVTVDTNGLITPVGIEGQTTVRTISDFDSNEELTTTVTVYEPEFESETNEFTPS